MTTAQVTSELVSFVSDGGRREPRRRALRAPRMSRMGVSPDLGRGQGGHGDADHPRSPRKRRRMQAERACT